MVYLEGVSCYTNAPPHICIRPNGGRVGYSNIPGIDRNLPRYTYGNANLSMTLLRLISILLGKVLLESYLFLSLIDQVIRSGLFSGERSPRRDSFFMVERSRTPASMPQTASVSSFKD